MPRSKILLDSSWLIALYDKGSSAHYTVREVSEHYRGQFLIPQIVLTEVVYLFNREMGIQGTTRFLQQFNESQPFLQEVTVADLRRVT